LDDAANEALISDEASRRVRCGQQG
jgi:hypothetical protein